jgi:hypothetical protein
LKQKISRTLLRTAAAVNVRHHASQLAKLHAVLLISSAKTTNKNIKKYAA